MRAIAVILGLAAAAACLCLSATAAVGWYQAVSLQDRLHQAETDLERLRSTNDQLQGEVASSQSELAKAKDRISQLEDKMDCGYKVEISYASNAQVSKSLADFVEGNFASVEQATWDVWWDEGDDALHTVTDVDEYVYDFFVFYENPDYVSQDGVFFITWGCWLDLPAGE